MTAATIVIPAYNEAGAIGNVVRQLQAVLLREEFDAEILVVVDGATDGTASEARDAGARIIEHPRNAGYGRSLKTGILAATHDLIAITDADGTYPAEQIPELLRLADRFDMVVGERTGAYYQGSLSKRLGRMVFRWLSEFAAGQNIPDINSGLRVFRRSDIVPYFPVISAGFSFTTTCTLVYLLNGLFVEYRPIEYRKRHGHSKVHHFRDSLRALQIIVEAILRCNPIKMFLLLALPFVLLTVPFVWWAIAGAATAGLLCATISLSTAGLILGLGFLSVACRPRDAAPRLVRPGSAANADRPA